MVGHTSTSVSLALGLATARDVLHESGNVIAVIGDGSLSGGEAFEGLDNAGEYATNFIVVVNDNEMSIAENHGGLYKSLAELRATGGKSENNYFKTLGFDYKYLEQGNDIASLIEIFKSVKDTTRPVVVHIHTQKGRGFSFAENNREGWHWAAPFDIETGEIHWGSGENYGEILGLYLMAKIKSDPKVVVIHSAVPAGIGFYESRRKEAGKQYIDAGEDGIAFCEGCGYAANLEKAERRAAPCADADCPAFEEVATPNAKTIEQVSAFMGLPADRFVKSLVYVADGKPAMVCVEGDRDVNEVKLKRFLDAMTVALADFDTVLKATGANAGFVGPVGPVDTSLRIVADIALKGAKGRIVGANKDEFHLKNVDLARDAKIADADYADLVVVKDGDICAKCGKPMVIKRGIEVGQVFKLGTKYSAAFNATYKNDKLEEHVMIMGCYGVGVSRTLQAVIEQSHDKDGIVWPASVAPYQVVVENLDPDREEVTKVADELEAALEAAGIDVIVDDRAERPGVKFKDADLIGFPVRVVVGAKGLANGGVEVKRRSEDKSKTRIVAPDAAVEAIKSALAC